MSHYPIEDLDLKNDSEEEQIRTRKIFDDLKSKAIKGEKLLRREKDFLCTCLKLTIYKEDGKPEDFSFCDDFIFKELYLTYFHNNLSGPFYKAKAGQVFEVSEKEKVKDLKTLQRISDNWLKEIEFEKHKNQILQELATETRKDLKELDKKIPRLSRKFRKKQDEYRLQKDKIILQSKFIFLLTENVIEDYETEDFKIPFSGQEIEFTSYSLIHITSRHYSEAIKNREKKTYHYKNFYPKELHIELKNILIEIDKLNIIDLNKTNNIIFTYEDVTYHLWIEKKTKQIKGQGNVVFNRIQTFYPIYDQTKLNELKRNRTLHTVNEKISVYD